MDIDFQLLASRQVTGFLWYSVWHYKVDALFLQKYSQVLQNWWRLWLQNFLWDVKKITFYVVFITLLWIESVFKRTPKSCHH